MRHLLKIFLLLITCLCGQSLYAQKEANTWYFGRYLGLDFNSGTAVPLNDGMLNTTEGVATISNSSGSLLFYTDGIKVWNKLHQVMPNGTGMFGDPSSTQSAVIVQKIGDTSRYYVFTVDAVGNTRGLNYSVVNMTLDNGKGDVELKNVPIQTNVVEKITAVKHCNNRDVWVLAHGAVSDIYYAYLVSPTGVNTTAVISHTGTVLHGVIPPATIDSTWLGYMKASPNGKKIAAAHWTMNLDVSDFDNATGVVSNSYGIFQPGDPHYLIYGVEFSPNSSLVYTTVFYTDPASAVKRNALFQYDVSIASPAGVRASKQVISQNSDPIQTYAALQIATDGKMYMAKNTYKHIASIGDPNVYGPGCNFTSNAIQFTLTNQTSSFGLPTFVQSYFYPVDSFHYTINCPGSSVSFTYTQQVGTSSVQWNFNDPASGANNTSTSLNPVHNFTAPGSYTVRLIKFTSCGPDTITRIVNTDALNLNLGPDTLVCGGSGSILLNSSAAGSNNLFLWQDGSTNPTYNASVSGLYWVQVSNAMGCVKRDSINVTFKPVPVFNLGADTAICSGAGLILNASVSNAASYLWNTGAVSSSITVNQVGLYWCRTEKDGCYFSDSLIITAVNPLPIVNLGNDSTLCGTSTGLLLNATNANSTYLWQNGSTNSTLLALTSGIYWTEVKNNFGCKKRDSINLNFKPVPVFNLGPDSAICQLDTLMLSASGSNATSYLWNTGATTATIKAYQAGLYWCETEKDGCRFRDSLTITSLKPLPVVNLGIDLIICEGLSQNLDATYLNSTYLWQDGSTNPVYTVSQQGTYRVIVNYNGCKRSDTVVANYKPKPVFTLGPDQLICQGNVLTLAPVLDPAWQLRWQDGSTNLAYAITQPGLYTLSATNNCGTISDDVLVTKGLCKVYAPNAFTPNSDGLNDVFRVMGTETVSQFNMKIFNQYGQIVFETNDQARGWDGKFKGQSLPNGAYVYLVSYKEINAAELKLLKGTVLALR